MNSRMRICHSYPKRTLSLLLGRNKHHIVLAHFNLPLEATLVTSAAISRLPEASDCACISQTPAP
jgi:hypothetical protein